jgi:hypothetical protein
MCVRVCVSLPSHRDEYGARPMSSSMPMTAEPPPTNFRVEATIPAQYVPLIIGKAGTVIQRISGETRTNIQSPRKYAATINRGSCVCVCMCLSLCVCGWVGAALFAFLSRSRARASCRLLSVWACLMAGVCVRLDADLCGWVSVRVARGEGGTFIITGTTLADAQRARALIYAALPQTGGDGAVDPAHAHPHAHAAQAAPPAPVHDPYAAAAAAAAAAGAYGGPVPGAYPTAPPYAAAANAYAAAAAAAAAAGGNPYGAAAYQAGAAPGAAPYGAAPGYGYW